MASDRGSARELRADEMDAAWLAGCDHLHVSGYALMLEPVRTAALRAVELARAQRARVSVDLGSWSAIRESGVDTFSVTPFAASSPTSSSQTRTRSVSSAARSATAPGS